MPRRGSGCSRADRLRLQDGEFMALREGEGVNDHTQHTPPSHPALFLPAINNAEGCREWRSDRLNRHKACTVSECWITLQLEVVCLCAAGLAGVVVMSLLLRFEVGSLGGAVSSCYDPKVD
jgi:hypothetical protein